MKLSIIIVNYNVRYFLEQCLQSVRKAVQGIDAEVLVVDNTSSDGSVEMVRELFPEVHLIADTENVGFSKRLTTRLSENRKANIYCCSIRIRWWKKTRSAKSADLWIPMQMPADSAYT